MHSAKELVSNQCVSPSTQNRRATGGLFHRPVNDRGRDHQLDLGIPANVEPGRSTLRCPVSGWTAMPSPPPPWRRARCVTAAHAALRPGFDDEIAAAGPPYRGPRYPGRRHRGRAHGETVSRAASSASPGPRVKPPRRTSCATCSPQLAACAQRRATRTTSSAFPNTVLAADQAGTRNVIVEMGMRGLHQLEELCGFVRPQWGLVTNVGEKPHRASGQPREHRARQAELLEALPAGGAWRSSTPRTICPRMAARSSPT